MQLMWADVFPGIPAISYEVRDNARNRSERRLLLPSVDGLSGTEWQQPQGPPSSRNRCVSCRFAWVVGLLLGQGMLVNDALAPLFWSRPSYDLCPRRQLRHLRSCEKKQALIEIPCGYCDRPMRYRRA